MRRYCCFSQKDTMKEVAPNTSSKKNKIICGLCKNEKTILTLECKHKVCLKCYSKYKYCTQCDKPGCWG